MAPAGDPAIPTRSINPQHHVTETAPLLAARQPSGNGRCRRTLCMLLLGSAIAGAGVLLGLYGHHFVEINNAASSNHTGNETYSHSPPSGHTTSLRPPRRSPPKPSPPAPTPSPPRAPSREDKFGKLIFHEDFLGSKLDDKTWNVEKTLGGGGNWEFQFYTSEAVRVSDGALIMQPGFFKDLGFVRTDAGLFNASEVMTGDCQPWPNCSTFHVQGCTNPQWLGCKRIGGDPKGNIINPILSGRINTKGKFSFRYGRLEFKARLPRGDFLWPALWLLPEDEVYGGWPASGEIDVMESRGNHPGYTVGGEQAGYDAFGSTNHWGAIRETDDGQTILLDAWRNAHAVVTHPDGGDFTQDFNIFGLYWDEQEMYTYTVASNGSEVRVLDMTQGFGKGFWYPPLGGAGDPVWDSTPNPYEGAPVNAPFDQKFYLIINVAVGGQEGNLGYWQDAPWGDCHQSQGCYTQGAFWDKRHLWLPSWEAARAQGRNALVVDSIKVWQPDGQKRRRGTRRRRRRRRLSS